MARVSLQYVWPDGTAVAVTVKVDASYPDAVSEARANAVSALREAVVLALVDGVAVEDDE